jgi:hypothetical protein
MAAYLGIAAGIPFRVLKRPELKLTIRVCPGSPHNLNARLDNLRRGVEDAWLFGCCPREAKHRARWCSKNRTRSWVAGKFERHNPVVC